MLDFVPVFGMRDGVYDGVVDSRRLGDHGGNRVHVWRQNVGVPEGEEAAERRAGTKTNERNK